MPFDPYAPPRALLDTPERAPAAGDALRAREENFAHEAGLRSIGVACLAFGGVMAVLGGTMLTDFGRYFLAGNNERSLVEPLVIGAVASIAGMTGLAGAWGYFRLRPWVGLLAVPLALGALLTSFGLATPAVLYAAWLTWSRTGRTILAPGYAAIVYRTPGWPAWWQLGHAAAMVAMVGGYAVAFYRVTHMDLGDF